MDPTFDYVLNISNVAPLRLQEESTPWSPTAYFCPPAHSECYRHCRRRRFVMRCHIKCSISSPPRACWQPTWRSGCSAGATRDSRQLLLRCSTYCIPAVVGAQPHPQQRGRRRRPTTPRPLHDPMPVFARKDALQPGIRHGHLPLQTARYPERLNNRRDCGA